MSISTTTDDLMPLIVRRLAAVGITAAGAGGSAAQRVPTHDLFSAYHTGTLDRSQAPWVATDISTAISNHVAAADPHPAYLPATGVRTGATSQAQAFSNGVQTGFGSAAAPAFAFVGDTDTGLIRSAANKLGLITAGTEWATLDSAGLLTVNKTLTAGWIKNSMIGFSTQGTADLGMLGFYDRNELVNADLRGTVTITFTGAGSVTTSTINNAFNSRGGFLSITGTDSTTTQIVIHIDMGATQPNYSAALWQPFLQYRDAWSLTSRSKYKNIVCEVSADNATWYKPSSGAWETTDASAVETVPGLWMGTNASPSIPGNVWRYVRFTLTNRQAGASFADQVSISQIGLRHYAAQYSRAWMYTSGDTMYGALVVKTSNAAAFDVQNASGTSLLKANTSATTVYVTGDLDVSDTLTALNGAIGTAYDSTATLKVQSTFNDDITLFLKQKSGQTARMWRVEDSAGLELIVLDSQGNLQSGNPGFVSGLTGWQITPTGTAEFNNVWVRGELHASIFVMDEFHASGGTLYIAPAGKLENPATVNVTTGIEAVFDIRTTSASGSGSQLDIRTTSATGSGSQLTLRTIENYFEISDPPSGHAMILTPGDRIRCKALGLGVGIDLWDVWGVVTRVEDLTSYYRYYYERKSGGTNGLVIPAGTAIISYGAPGAGRIYLTADQNYAPYMQVFLSGEEPWNGQITPTVRIGRLDGVGLPGVSGIEQHGIVLSSNLSNASAPYLVASNLKMFQYKIDSEWNNGNPTARISADGTLKLGTNIDSPTTTGLAFDPATGSLAIGSATYPGTVTVYGSITVTAGSGYTNFSDKPTSLSGINGTEGAKLAGIAANATVGATWGTNLNSIPTRFGDAPSSAGLYLTATHLGYYNGSAWKAWIASSGEFYFGGNSGAHLEWNGSKLRGIGADGTTEQWYAQSSDGKFYAAAGGVWIDNAGINIAVDTIGTPDYIRFDRSGSTVGSIGFLRSTGMIPDANDGMIFYNNESTKFRFLGATQTEFGMNVYVTGFISTTGDAYIGGNLEADNVLNIRTTAP